MIFNEKNADMNVSVVDIEKKSIINKFCDIWIFCCHSGIQNLNFILLSKNNFILNMI